VGEARRVVRFAHASHGRGAGLDAVTYPAPITRHWAWGGATGRGVRVCVIDSGLDAEHPAVGGAAEKVHIESTVLPDGTVRREVVPDGLGDLAGHGTACAGIIRALAPECGLTSVRILGRTLKGSGEALSAGLEWAIEQRFHVVNLSLSTRKPEVKERLHDLVDQAYFAGVTIVASAHNSPVDSYPWRFPSVISVGSHGAPEPDRIELNPTPPVDFFAAGVNIRCAWLRGGYRSVSGNSFATPYVAGLCARILELHPSFRTPQLRTVLSAVADNLQ
jgi:subtilisin family serine protease